MTQPAKRVGEIDMKRKIIRLIDANLNRAKEAARVCEEIARFVVGSPNLSGSYKKIRHEITKNAAGLNLSLKTLLDARDVKTDAGLKSISSEMTRKDVGDIFFANMQRLKESIRVLEEFSKITNKAAAENFKTLRFRIYALEKKTSIILSSLRNR